MARERRYLDIDDLIRDYRSGSSVKKLAEQHSVDRSTILSRLISHGIQIRGRSEAERLKWQVIKLDRHLVERQCSAAWAQARIKNRGEDNASKIAITRERLELTPYRREGRFEKELADAIIELGVPVKRQKACGTRNMDIALAGTTVAVEVCCSTFHRSMARERSEYIFNRGWSVLFIWRPLSKSGKLRMIFNVTMMAQKSISFLKIASRNPSTIGQYGVIRCDGQFVAPKRFEPYAATRIERF